MSLPDDQLIGEAYVPVEIGEVLQGKYRVDRRVGSGGMAAVFAGRHLELDQAIAIKFLLPEHAATPDAVRRFLSEARAAARLDSPHVARVLDVGTAETKRGAITPFIVMELLEGQDLDGLLQQRGALPIAEAVEYVLQACSGVAEAHAAGIIHRDLKPGNLFLTVRRDGSPVIKLLDFGISKNVSRSRKNEHAVTADRELMGSPGYMSPEQVRSSKDVDPRTDVWSLGVILHELLTGTHPFLADTTADTFVEILHSPPRSIRALAPHVPQALDDVVMKCLQKKPSDRYDAVEALAAALAPFRSATPLLIPDLVPQALDAPNADAGVSVRTVHDPPKRRVVLTAMLSFGAVGLVLIAVVGLAKLRAGRAEPAQPTSTANVSAAVAPPPPEESAPAPSLPATIGTPDDQKVALPGATSSSHARPPRDLRPVKPAAAPPPKVAPKPPASAPPRHRTDW